MEAARKLGWDTIDGFVDDGDARKSRMWEISENLHRAELTALERSELLAEWVKLAGENKVAQVAGRQPRDIGINAASRDLGIKRDEAQRAVKIAGLSDPAKDAAR